jgi:hypothetical protein
MKRAVLYDSFRTPLGSQRTDVARISMKRTQLRNLIFIAPLVCWSFLLVSCGSKVQGTYTDASGRVILELRSGGRAVLTFMGETAPCTYTVEGNKLTLACKAAEGFILAVPRNAGDTVFTIHDDGSLTGPPGAFIHARAGEWILSPLRKTKS